MLKQLEKAIILAAMPQARETVRTMLETYRLIIDSRSRNEFMSILLHTREMKQFNGEEQGVK